MIGRVGKMKCLECNEGEMEIVKEDFANVLLKCNVCGYKDYN